MAEKILGPTGSKRRKRFLLVPILLVASAALLLISSAQAVHDLDFQLDGNALSTVCGTTPDGNCSVQKFDWGRTGTTNTNYIFNANRSVNTSVVDSANTTGFTAAAFQRDFGLKVSAADNCSLTSTDATKAFCTADTTTFATGSKDTQNISGGGADQAGNWQCNRDNNVNSKIDITNAYSAAYNASNGDRIMYFAMEKNKDNGNNNAGFWFLQGDANCVSTGSAVDFSGNHRNGDILVTSAFTSGGGVSSILVFRWAGGANGCIDSNPNAAPACDQQPIGSGGDCKTAPTTPPPAPVDTICATTNSGPLPTNSNITVPWLTADATLGVGNTVVPPDFFEGAINISKAFRDAPGGGSAPTCFNTFIADTRSSQSATATLFDFARGVLGQCNSTTTTTPVDATDNTQPPASAIPVDPADAKVDVKDKTVITVNGVSSFTGSISWHVCGPTAATSTQLCDGTTGNVGVDLGSQSITTAGTYYSPTATVTSAGRYCFRAEFSGDSTAGVPGSGDSRATECFTVAPAQPTLTTDATDGPVDFGQPISDTVSLSGTAHKPGSGGPTGSNGTINPTTLGGDATGNIIVKAFGPDSCSTVAFTSSAIAASGDGTSYGGPGSAFEFTPSAPGQYIFVASYAGDSPNTLGVAESACSAAPDAEKVTVRQIPSQISTGPTWVPNDSATVTSSVTGNNLPANGTITFSLYGPTTGKTASENCLAGGTTGRLYSKGFSTGAAAHSQSASSDNATSFSTDETLYWLVTYAPGDTAHTGRQSQCTEAIVVDVTGDSGPGTLFPSP